MQLPLENRNYGCLCHAPVIDQDPGRCAETWTLAVTVTFQG
jgi:hypothetical protein